jgi:hypothetical protein
VSLKGKGYHHKEPADCVDVRFRSGSLTQVRFQMWAWMAGGYSMGCS